MVLEDDGAHAAALCQFRKIDGVNRTRNSIGRRVRMHVDRAGKRLRGRRRGNNQKQGSNGNRLHQDTAQEGKAQTKVCAPSLLRFRSCANHVVFDHDVLVILLANVLVKLPAGYPFDVPAHGPRFGVRAGIVDGCLVV